MQTMSVQRVGVTDSRILLLLHHVWPIIRGTLDHQPRLDGRVRLRIGSAVLRRCDTASKAGRTPGIRKGSASQEPAPAAATILMTAHQPYDSADDYPRRNHAFHPDALSQ